MLCEYITTISTKVGAKMRLAISELATRPHCVIGHLGCSNNPLCMISHQQGVLKRDQWSHCWWKF